MRYVDRFVFLSGLLIFVSIVAIWGNVSEYWQGRRPGEVSGIGFAFRLLREGVLAVILIDAGFTFLRQRAAVPVTRLGIVFWSFAIAYAVLVAAVSLMNGLVPGVVVAGFRFFEYLPLIFIAYVVASWYGEDAFHRLGKIIVWYVAIQTVVGTAEIFFLPEFFHGRTFLGARPFGTLASPNIFGNTMAVCALFLALQDDKRFRKWILPCALMAVASGSRAAMLGVGLTLAYLMLRSFRATSDKAALVMMLLPILGGAYLIASSEALSGRAIEGEGRIDTWTAALSAIESPADLLFGWGVGLGSNTVSTLYGEGAFPGQHVADSFFVFLIGSYGVIGLSIYVSILVLMLWRYQKDPRIVAVLAAVIFFSAIRVIWEIYPANVLLALMLGWLLGSHGTERQAAVPPRPQFRGSEAAGTMG